jgi:hypothetical protein
MPSLGIALSIIATILALLSFSREIWRTWRDRPKLNFYINAVTFRDVPHFGEVRQIRILICNVGYRPIILVRFRAFGQSSAFAMGINDEPAAALGIEQQRFPAKIEPGECLKIHPLGMAALERNQTDPEDSKVHFDPWRVFVVEDSFGRLYPMEMEDVKRELHIGRTWKSYRGLPKLKRAMGTWLFLRKARKKLMRF